MFNPTKKVEGIDSFYINKETGKHVNAKEDGLDLKALCSPDPEWITEKCMKHSKKYREALDKKFKVKVTYPVLAQRDPKLNEWYKNRVMASYDAPRVPKPDVLVPVFLTCSNLYYEHCKEFHLSKQKDVNAILGPVSFQNLA